MSRLSALALLLALSAGRLVPLSAAPAPAPAPKVPVELLQARRDAAEEALRVKWVLWRAKRTGVDPHELVQWSRRLLEAEKALGPEKQALIAAGRNHWEMTRYAEELAQGRMIVGRGTQADVAAARYFRLEAEIWLVEAGGKVPEGEKPPDDDLLDRWLHARPPARGEARPLPMPPGEPLRMPRPDDRR